MEKEKTEDRSRSQNLLSIIEKLQEQKTFIEERLVLAKRTESFNQKTRAKEVLHSHKKLKNTLGDYLHYPNIGILHVTSYTNEAKTEMKFDSQGEFALEGLRILQEKEKIWEEKLGLSQRENQSLIEKYKSLINKFNILETKLTKKRRKISQITQFSELAATENRYLSQFFELFEEKTTEVLSRMSLDFIKKLEGQLHGLLEAIQFEKTMRTMKTSIENEQFARFSKENLDDFLTAFRQNIQKPNEISLKEEFMKEIGVKIDRIEEKTLLSGGLQDVLSKVRISVGNNVENNNVNMNNENITQPHIQSFQSTSNNDSLPQSYVQGVSNNNNNSTHQTHVQSFKTYFEKEQLHDNSSQFFSEMESKNEDPEPFQTKLDELQRNFNEIKEKIKEKSFEMERNREISPMRRKILNNKENVNLSRREPTRNNNNNNNSLMNAVGRKFEYRGSTSKKTGGNARENFGLTQNVAPVFERHLEVLRSSTKNNN